jgi:hypothetical protein
VNCALDINLILLWKSFSWLFGQDSAIRMPDCQQITKIAKQRELEKFCGLRQTSLKGFRPTLTSNEGNAHQVSVARISANLKTYCFGKAQR